MTKQLQERLDLDPSACGNAALLLMTAWWSLLAPFYWHDYLVHNSFDSPPLWTLFPVLLILLAAWNTASPTLWGRRLYFLCQAGWWIFIGVLIFPSHWWNPNHAYPFALAAAAFLGYLKQDLRDPILIKLKLRRRLPHAG